MSIRKQGARFQRSAARWMAVRGIQISSCIQLEARGIAPSQGRDISCSCKAPSGSSISLHRILFVHLCTHVMWAYRTLHIESVVKQKVALTSNSVQLILFTRYYWLVAWAISCGDSLTGAQTASRRQHCIVRA